MSVSILRAVLLSSVVAPLAVASTATWEATETVDPGATSLASASGQAVAYVDDGWFVTYVAGGEVVIRERDDATGWGSAVPLTSGAGAVTEPQLATVGGVVHVTWEDDRNGHPEIYTRRLVEGVWSVEECLSCDGVRSADASLSARPRFPSDDEAFLVWEDGAEGSTGIRGRRFNAGAWEAVVDVSQSPGVASDPTVTSLRSGHVAIWTDSRNGHLDVYRRDWPLTGSTPGENLTDFESDDAVAISIRHENLETDFPQPHHLVVYRKEGSATRLRGIVLVDDWVASSFDLAISSTSNGQAASFTRDTSDFCAFWGGIHAQGEWFVARGYGGDCSRTLEVVTFDGFDEAFPSITETMTTTGVGDLHLGTMEGFPDARLLAVWIEDVGGTPTLKARPGHEIGGSATGVVSQSASLLISPAGSLSSTIEVENLYTGESVDCQACLYFEAPGVVFDDDVTDYCEDPPSPFVFHVRGGGCGSFCRLLRTAPVDDTGPSWVGIRSPDVDGNCVVDAGDVAYVESMVGTDDFCADLDGSGLVDQGDLDIATMTLGDACASVDVPGSPPAVVAPALALAPNPARSTAYIRLSVPGATAARVAIYDAAGREVRDLTVNVEAGSTLVPWDLRDQRGRRLSAGAYFVTVRAGETTLRSTMTIVE